MATYYYLVQKRGLTRDEALEVILPVKGKNYRITREAWYGVEDKYLLYAPVVNGGSLIMMEDGAQVDYTPSEEDLAATDYMVLKRTSR